MADEAEKKLNPQQKEAVEYGEGPLLIIAGAGTGKTTVVTERIKYLITSGQAKTEQILALTFTDKAAREMEERVDLAMPYGYTQMWISTFHSFCDRVLRQEALQIGLDPSYRLMTEAETTQFLIKNLFSFKLDYFRPLGNPTKFVDGMLQHFSRLKDEDVAPAEYLNYAQKVMAKAKTKEEKDEVAKIKELAGAYQQYEQLKVKEGLVDFSDLIAQTLRLFRTRKNILQQYQQQFKYLLVDEFQDTNYAQNELAILLAGKKANITVTADDDQSIYRWRGAAISNVIQFRDRFPKAKIVVLIKNYRSTQLILDKAYQLIQNNNPDRLEFREKINKHLQAVRQVKEAPLELIRTDRVENEAEAVVRTIKGLTDGSIASYPYGEIAILVRANNHADPFGRALSRAGLPYQFLGPGQLFRQPEVKDLIAYLKLLYNFEDNVALFKVLSMAVFALSARDLAAIGSFGRRKNISLFEACEQVERVWVADKTKQQIKDFVAMVHRHLKLLSRETAGQILYYFLQDTGLLRQLAEAKSESDQKRSQNLAKFFDRLKTYEVDHEDASVFAVVDWISLSMDLGESPLANNLDWTLENKVNLLTVHSAKGLEFPVVFLVNLAIGRFPTYQRREQIPIPEALIKEILPSGDYHQQEERRLFYVAMTRAADRLYFSVADYYGEGKRERKISPFVVEALGEKALKTKAPEVTNQLSIFDFQPPAVSEEESQERLLVEPINYLSYSQIEAFDRCPLLYYYRYIQRIPVPISAAASFGSSIHSALRDFYALVKEGKKVTEQGLQQLLEKNWSPEGYASLAHEKRQKAQGQKILSRFFSQGFDPQRIPLSSEQTFVIRASPNLKIGGKIDRVDPLAQGLEIIDYKTGKTWEQKQVEESLQATVYALAVADPGIYGQKPEKVIFSFYFLESGEKKSSQRNSQQLVQAKKKLVEKAQEIKTSQFEPKPSRLCDFCEYKLLCEAWQ